MSSFLRAGFRSLSLLTLLNLLSHCNVFAQFSDSVHYHVKYAGAGTLNNTNGGSTYLFNNNISFNTRRRRLEGNLTAGWLYGKQGRRLTNNDLNSTLDFNRYLPLPRAYYWGLGTFEKSYSLKVNTRTQAGMGLAYNVIDRRDSLFFNISDGILYEYSNLNIGDTAQDLYNTFRNSLRLRLRYRFRSYIILEGTGFIQHSLTDGSDYIIRSNAGISLKLFKGMTFTTALLYNKVNRTRSENLLLTFGLTLEHWF
jgi:hypothetical protein